LEGRADYDSAISCKTCPAWQSPNGIGTLDTAAWDQTVTTAMEGGVLTAEPADGAYRTDLTAAALEGLESVTGDDWQKPVVEVTPGGE